MFSSFHRPEPRKPATSRDDPPELTAATEQPVVERVPSVSVEPMVPAVASAALEPALPTVDHELSGPATVWADLTKVPLDSDQLGLANPAVITLFARLPASLAVRLEADTAGIFRPQHFRPAPWSGFAYDQPRDTSTGFAAGTRILTSRGEVEVERLLPGDAAMTLRGPALLPITWIGRGVAAEPPITIERGALGPDLPRRTLCLGADQPVFTTAVPVAARTLVNGTTIRMRQENVFELFQIDVGRAEVIFAEGVALVQRQRCGPASLMLRETVGLFADEEASMLADLAQLTPEPAGVLSRLVSLGYEPEPLGTGLYAPGSDGMPVLLFPLYHRAGLAVRKRQLVGQNVSRSATLAAGLTALRSMDRRPPLLFLAEQHAPPPGIAVREIVSLEGGVVPRIWRHCFGSFDATARITGRRSHPGLSNTAINAIESSVPILQALLHLKADIQLRSAQRGHFADAPLQPRLTISAAHGGMGGSVLPVVFDVLANRRYDPTEDVGSALEELRATILAATPRSERVELAITRHDPPLPDPDEPNRSREERALAIGWGWPQVRFCSSSTLIPGATILGGLERPDHAAQSEEASTTLDEMSALVRTLRALLLEG